MKKELNLDARMLAPLMTNKQKPLLLFCFLFCSLIVKPSLIAAEHLALENNGTPIDTNHVPTPICHDGIRVDLQATIDGFGRATVQATDLLVPDSMLLGIAPEAYSIYKIEHFNTLNDSIYVSPFEDASVRSLSFTCDDLDLDGSDGLILVRIYAEDEVGNKGYCNTFIQVQNNSGACAAIEPSQIVGQIQTVSGNGLAGVRVDMTGNRTQAYLTDANGNFIFFAFFNSLNTIITPKKDQDHSNGVSTFDLVLMQKHILGQNLLNTPYKLIAADVNNSSSITTLDLIEARKLILNLDSKFKNNTSWRFVDTDYNFPDPTNPWTEAFPESKIIDTLRYQAIALFTAIKIGDVNNSAITEANAQAVKPRSNGFSINTPEQTLIDGQEYVIPFYLDEKDIIGYQFALHLKQIELLDIIYGPTTPENFGFFQEEEILTTSFNGPIEGELFKLVIRPKVDAQLSDLLSITSQPTKAEAYTKDGQSIALDLIFTTIEVPDTPFDLFQNIPNPFQQATAIEFDLPKAGEAQLIIQDIAGRIVRVIEGDFIKGRNLISLQCSDFPNAGVYFYTLVAKEYSLVKKMMFLGNP